MNYFIGEYRYSVDDKKRLGIPQTFREKLGTKAIITKGFDTSLFLFSLNEWEKMASELSALSVYKAGSRGVSRLLLAGAMEVSFDTLGRILIPDYLKEYAGIARKAVVTGMYSRVEIWNEEEWETYKKKMEKDAEKMAEDLIGT